MTGGRSKSEASTRHVFLLVIFLSLFAVVAGRLVWIQAVAADGLAEKAFNQRLKDVELAPRRGTVYDREGEPLAVTVEAKTVYVAPNQVEDKEAVAVALAQALGGDVNAYRKRLSRDSGFEYVARKVDVDRAAELKAILEDQDLKGVGFIEDYRRLYPSGELACQVLGFVGTDDKGLAGIESAYDEVLSGTPGVLLGERDPSGRPIPGGVQKEIPPTHGHDVVLTIDKDIQYESQVALAEAIKKWGAKSGSVIVMNPRNGEIYAMTSWPGFNPNEFRKAADGAIRNKPICDTYEPGSTIKALTAAAVIEKGVYGPDSKLSLPSTIKVGGRTIHESHGRGAVTWTLTDIVTKSSNVGSVKLGMKLGGPGLYKAFTSFGVNAKTGVDFPGEASGSLPKLSQWSSSSIGNIPFGQGLAVTPLQLSRAISAIANGGMMPTPHFLLEVPNSDAVETGWASQRATNATTAAAVNRILQAVVTEGTGSAAAVKGYAVAGKTGTAQKAAPGGGGYASGLYVGSFIGYLPAEDPQVLVCVTIDEPSNAIYGATVAAPTFSRLAGFAVSHLKIPPSTAVQSQTTTSTQGHETVSKDARDE